MALSFERALAPLPLGEFISDYWSQAFCHIQGERGRFETVLPWSELNRILEQHRLEHPRLRTAMDGKSTSEATSEFVKYDISRRRNLIPRVDPIALNRLLSKGATLIVDAVDEMSEPVRKLAESFEDALRESVQVNLYAGWRDTRGFDLHWDDHDVFVLQVHGRKRWAVHGETRKYPLFRDISSDSDGPTEPLWEGMLESGDILYIPRGWWHVAVPVNEPTLHLTFGVNVRNGIDFIGWLGDHLREYEIFRKDLPTFSSVKERKDHYQKMRDIVSSLVKDDLFEKYLEEHWMTLRSRPRLILPWSATDTILPGNLRIEMRPIPRPSVHRDRNEGTVVVLSDSRRWEFSDAVAPVLEALVERGGLTVSQLEALIGDSISLQERQEFLKQLVSDGLLHLVRS